MKNLSLTALLFTAFISNAQLGKNLETKLSGGGEDPLNELPKGYEMYSTTHTDNAGISGVYYTKYPIQFMYRTTMNTYKTFTVDQITLEFVEDKFAGRIHVVNDAVSKLVRQAGTDLSSTWDFYGGGSGESQKHVAKMFDFYAFNIKSTNFMFGSIMGVSKKGGPVDGAQFFRNKDDKDVIFLGKIIGDELRMDRQYAYGNNFNVLSKDKAKLANYDSTQIANALMAHNKLNIDYFNKAMGDLVLLPKQAVNDDAREKEYFNIIMEMAAQDKPVAWADKFVYCYINEDWKDIYKGTVKTHRNCKVIAVSKGWSEGSEGRYIPVNITQNWDGSTYGKAYVNGFIGSLVPVSAKTIDEFAH